MILESSTQLTLLAAISESFRPYTPIDDLELFSGRLDQAAAILDTIYEGGRHAIVYGDRGVGKTSLANVIDALLQRRATVSRSTPPVVRTTCDSSDSFSSIWHRVFDQLTISQRRRRAGLTSEHDELQLSFTDLLPELIRPADVVAAAEALGRVVVILDEFDRLQHKESVHRAFADALKGLSDADVALTVVLVGVGRDVTDPGREPRGSGGEDEQVDPLVRQVDYSAKTPPVPRCTVQLQAPPV